MKLTFDQDAIEDLQSLHKGYAKRILEKLKQFVKDPDAQQNNIKILKGSSVKRLRVGNYRIMSVTEDDAVIITAIKHRKEAYK